MVHYAKFSYLVLVGRLNTLLLRGGFVKIDFPFPL